MNGETLWNTFITTLSSLGEEIQTKTGLWFRASFCDGRLYIDNATDNKPSCKLSMQRVILKKDFLFINSLYDRWASGETGISQVASRKSQNTAYIFALINKFNNG